MDRDQTLKVLTALANGIHPATGEVFAPDSAYQDADTVRALFEAMRAVEAMSQTPQGERERARGEMPANTYVRWTREEEERLAAGFDAGKTSAELAKVHNRSRAAIEARLLRLGKIDVSALTVQLRYTPKGGDTARTAGS